MAAITVTSLADNVFPGGGVTLREAIQAANTDTSVDGSAVGNGADTILFDAALFATPRTITLDGTQLEITEALTIDATSLAANVTIDANEESRIFNISAATGDFTLSGLTITGGKTIGHNAHSLDTTFSGGAIRSLTTGRLTIDQSRVNGNSTTGEDAEGGGIFSVGNVLLTSSTANRNSTTGGAATGGGISSSLGTVTLTSSTVTDNRANFSNATGGGIWNDNNTITIANSIVAGNTAGGGNPDIDPGTGIFTIHFSLLGSAVTPDAGSSDNLSSDNLLLGLLANNGGPTETHALLAGSLAIDAGDPVVVSPPSFDQRGSGFDRVRDGNGDTTVVIDIGAFELQTPIAPSADFDNDNDIDGADFLAWQRGFNKLSNVKKENGDANNDSNVDGDDLGIWESQFSSSSAVAASTSAALPSAATAPLIAVQQSLEEPENVASSITTSSFSTNVLLQLGGFGQSFAPISSQISSDGFIEKEKDKVFHDLPDRRSSFSSDLLNSDRTDVSVQALATAEPESRTHKETVDHALEQLADDALTMHSPV